MVELSDLVDRVAEYTAERDMEGEDWQKAVAVNGLIATGEDRFAREARRLIDRSIETQTSAGQLSYGSLDPKPWDEGDSHYQSQTDPTALGIGALEFYDRTGDERYLDAARRAYEYLRDRAIRTDDGGIAHHRGPVELWVDAIYMLCPFLARYGRITGETATTDEAVRQAEVLTRHLQDPRTDLFRHQWHETPDFYPQGTFWSRGNGWAAAGLLDTLEYLPDDHPGRSDLTETFEQVCGAVLERQDDSGYWHNILDDPQSPLETSGTLMFAYAFTEGARRGLLDDDAYVRAAEDAMSVCEGVVDEDGAVRRVVGPPGGPGVPFAVTSYGQGWFLLAASKLL